MTFKQFSLLVSTILISCFTIACQSSAVVPDIQPPLNRDAAPDSASETLAQLQSADIPARDMRELLTRINNVTIEDAQPHIATLGDVETFWYLEGGQANTQVEAELLYQTESLNFWVDTRVNPRMNKVIAAATVLENDIIPTTRTLFGNEPNPGIDGDARINFLHIESLGKINSSAAVGGYFNMADRQPVDVNPFSNEREMLYINLKAAPLETKRYFSVIAHELQHLVLSANDGNELTWLDEGLAELSAEVNLARLEDRYSRQWANEDRMIRWRSYINLKRPSTTLTKFAALTDLQLTDWNNTAQQGSAHYGASYLFSIYFADRFGQDAIKQLVTEPANSFAGYAATLTALGSDVTIDELFGDWVVANYLNSIGRPAEPWTYNSVSLPPLIASATHGSFPSEATAAVAQYGTDYIVINADAPVTLAFEGSTTVPLINTAPASGDSFVTTLPADRSDMTLTRAFDLRSAEQTTTTLRFETWYQIESGWDYGYILASADDGTTWDMLRTIYSTQADPHGNNLGVAISGRSSGGTGFSNPEPLWTTINVDLTPYVGKEILLRFEYVTDDAVHEAGWAIDDIAIPAIGYLETFDNGISDWDGYGWVQHGNVLPQTWLVQAIYIGDDIQVETLTLDALQSGRFELATGAAADTVVLTVSGTTPLTTERAAYRYTIRR